MRGLHAATTTLVSALLRMSSEIISWPGLEHMYLYDRALTTPGISMTAAATVSASTILAMLVPQLQM